MSYPNIPDVTPTIDVNGADIINLLLASIAFEELGLAHIINSEAEKIQYVLGTLEGQTQPETPPTIPQLLTINRSVDQSLRSVIKTQMLLQFKLEDILTIITGDGGNGFISAGSAWSVGTPFGQGNAQYTTLGAEEEEKTVDLGLGANHIPIGTVQMTRNGTNLEVTISTNSPYVMDQTHLYVSDAPPVNSAPGSFPYQYTVTDPADYFTSHTFIVDVSGFAGDTLYIAAHAHVFLQI